MNKQSAALAIYILTLLGALAVACVVVLAMEMR